MPMMLPVRTACGRESAGILPQRSIVLRGMIGLETRPEYTSYEVTEDMTAEDNANTAEGTGAATDGGEKGNAADNTTGAIDSDTPQIRILTEKYNGLTENTGSAPVRSEKWQNRILCGL